MKKISLFCTFLLATVSMLAAVNPQPVCRVAEQTSVTLPIVSTEPITEAPAGTVISNMVRKGFSYYYNSGVYGGYNDSFVGEIVIGDDGCIYIKNACASTTMNTYLKLDPVNDTLFVAHTAQMIYVDMTYDTPYTYYATRLVYTQISDSQFSWQVEEVGGQVQNDVYFTYIDGVLRQRDQTRVVKGEYTYPYEIIGFTNVSGGWIGFGDGCIVMESINLTPTTLPAEATPVTGNLSYQMLSSRRGVNATDAMQVRIAEVGDDYYVNNPLNEQMWIRGTIDRTNGTVTFRDQYIGVNNFTGVHQWFMPSVYNDWFDLIDEEENYGYWMRSYDRVDSIVCSYNNGLLISDTASHQCFSISRSADNLEASGQFANITLQPYAEHSVAPADPIITYFDKYNGLWGEFGFYLQPVDSTNMLLNKSELFYRIYHDRQTTPYTFTTSDYSELSANTTDIPFGYDDLDFVANSIHHMVIFYERWKNAGVQAVYKHNGHEYCSAIVWTSNAVDAIESVESNNSDRAVKIFRNGQLLIEKEGVVYTVMGQIVQ